MIVYVIALLSFQYSTVAGSWRGRHRTFGVNEEMTLLLNIGTPRQLMLATLDTAIADFMVMDVACTDPRSLVNCPRYCEDKIIRSTFCSPLCVRLTPVETELSCVTDFLYRPNASSTFVDLQKSVEWRFQRRRPFSGLRAKDAFSVDSRISKKATSDNQRPVVKEFELEGHEFVRGLRYDMTDLKGYTSIMGLAPRPPGGEKSLIPQLKAVGQLDRAVVTLHQTNYPIFRSNYVQSDYGNTMTAGAVNNFNCIDWRQFPVRSQTDWDFRISKLTFLGSTFENQIERYTTIPKIAFDKFVAAMLFTLHPRGYWEIADPAKMTALEFTVAEQPVRLVRDSLLRGRRQLKIRSGDSVEYTDDERWVFGRENMGYICYGYDYDRGVVLWGDKRFIRINYDYDTEFQ